MKYCSRCGTKCNDIDMFCPKCGHKFENVQVDGQTIVDADIKANSENENASAHINENVNKSAKNDPNSDLLHQNIYNDKNMNTNQNMEVKDGELVFGIVSIILSMFGFFIGQLVGIGLAIYALVRYPKGKYKALSIVGLILNILVIVVGIVIIVCAILFNWEWFKLSITF